MIKHRFSDGTPVFVVPLTTLDGSSLGLGTGGDTKEAREKAVRVREHLMLFKTEGGVMHGWMMKIAPTFEYQQQTKGDFQNNTFEGKILVNDLDDKFVKGFVYYPGGIGQYSSNQGNNGLINIEFEAHLFKDLSHMVEMQNGGAISAVSYGHPKYQQYQIWLSEITNGFTSYPTQINLNSYFEFMQAFKESYSGTGYDRTIRYDLYPNALMNLTASRNCP